MMYKIYKDPEGYWVVESVRKDAMGLDWQWEFEDIFRWRWQARRYVKALNKNKAKPKERFVEFH